MDDIIEDIVEISTEAKLEQDINDSQDEFLASKNEENFFETVFEDNDQDDQQLYEFGDGDVDIRLSTSLLNLGGIWKSKRSTVHSTAFSMECGPQNISDDCKT